uniref:IPT/TIG domain-containing protein n=1 Tax=Globisporangium ultimum (strain ATCC 200006 / CBS 805.95 / DAOM BR144) TaxID=431595 RepID=K3WKI3_GLOUD
QPTVSATVPSYIDESSERLVVLGSNFRNLSLLKCVFGSSPTQLSDARFINSTAVSCVMPRLENPNVWVSLVISLGDTAGIQDKVPFLVRYLSRPLIMSASPLIGSSSGGSLITIFGQGMLSLHDLRCNYVGIGSAPVALVSSSLGQCNLPPSLRFESFQTILQIVRAKDRATVLASFNFNVIEPLKITRISPRIGLLAGGYNITVLTASTGLLKTTSISAIFCVIGRFRVIAHVMNSSTVVCATPIAEQPMSVPVSLSTEGNTDFHGTTRAYFTYVAPIRLAKVIPPRSPVVGNSTIIVQTRDPVHQGIDCLFGTTPVPGKVMSDTELSCITPSHPEDVLTLRLAVNESTMIVLSENAIMFEYYSPQRSVSVDPPN